MELFYSASVPTLLEKQVTRPLADVNGNLRVSIAGNSTTLLSSGTDRSGTINTGGTAQQLAPANTSRRALRGQNISDGDLWINEMGSLAVVGAAGSYRITPGSSFAISTNQAVSIVGATTGQKFTASEM